MNPKSEIRCQRSDWIVRGVTRRQFLTATAAIGAASFAYRTHALESAKNLEEVWSDVRAGRFELAVQRLQLHVTDWPLDRDARSSLAVMQFAAGAFDSAAENLGRVVKLQRGVSQAARPRFEIDYLEAWYRLAQLRAGRTPDILHPASPHSLLAVLVRAEHQPSVHQSVTTELADAYFAYLDQLEKEVGKETVTRNDGTTATAVVNINRPERHAVEQAYLCISNFMLGEQALGFDDQTSGRQFLAAAVDSKAESEVEYHIAGAELARLAPPK